MKAIRSGAAKSGLARQPFPNIHLVKELKDGIRSKVRIDYTGRVHKWFRGTDKEKRCENEARILRALEERECPYVPRLLEYHPEDVYIVTTNCGQPAPDISRKKSDALFAELERVYGVRHDDPEPRNVTYSPVLGRFCLIDFELAELLPLPTEVSASTTDVWRVRWASLTQQGIRHRSNDDSFLALEVGPSGPRAQDAGGEILLDPGHLVLAVSDGMGGGNAGEFASRLILSWIRKYARELYESLDDSEDASPLADLLRNAHRGLNALATEDPNLKGMGATVTLAWITPARFHLGHIGDSRLYLHRPEGTSLLSKDHTSAFNQWKSGQISELQFRQHPRRSALYDILGAGHPNIHPQIASHPLSDGDRLLLCTDGIVDGLWERGIQAELSRRNPPREVAQTLLERAREASKSDDATLIIADISQL